MKQVLLGILSLAISVQRAPIFIPVDQGSSVKFEIKNFGFTVNGSFTGLKGTVQFEPNALDNSSFNVSIDANTINTGIDMRDDHLRDESYFNVKKYPRIQFVSSHVTPGKKAGTFFVSGNLTIKETTKEISFPFTAQPQADGLVFNGEFKINRRDFSLGGSSTISNELLVKLEVVAKK